MPYYRLFFLDRSARVVRAEVVASPNDSQITSVVRRLLASRPPVNCPALDVWQSDRLVGRFAMSALTGAGPESPANAAGMLPLVPADL